MSIIPAELKWYKSLVVNDGSSNGGVMSANQSISGIKNNIFPDVTQEERDAGISRHRKLFGKVANDDDETLYNARLHMISITPGEDFCTFFVGTQVNTQNDITGAERQYAAGSLANDINAGATQLVVTVESSSMAVVFVDTDKIWIGDGIKSEYHENVTVVKVALDYTITLDTGDTILHDYLAATPTFVASVYEPPDVIGSADNWIETSVAGTYDEAGSPVEPDSIGAIEDSITVTFTDDINFTVTGVRAGSMGSGNISTDFAPINTDFSKPYFVLRAAGWGGTWANGETVTFDLHPAAVPAWFKQQVLPGTASYSGDNFRMRIGGESA